MNRFLAAIVAVFFMSSCSQSVSLPKDKAEFARQEIERIAKAYIPLADEAFADEGEALRYQRAALSARLMTIIEVILMDVNVNDSSGLWEVLAKAAIQLIGGAQ